MIEGTSTQSFSVVGDTEKGNAASKQRQIGSATCFKSEPHQLFILENDAVIRVYDEAGNVIETHEHAGEFREF